MEAFKFAILNEKKGCVVCWWLNRRLEKKEENWKTTQRTNHVKQLLNNYCYLLNVSSIQAYESGKKLIT